MPDNPLAIALKLIAGADPELREIISLSLLVSGSALAVSCTLGIPLGAAIAIGKWPGQSVLKLLVSIAMGLPPVVVGLVLYLLLSRQGALGWLAILYTPQAMILAQTILATPIVAGFAAETLGAANRRYGELLRSLALSRRAALATLLVESRAGLVAAALAGFGRAISEVGAVLVVGGNIAHATRIMTTAIALETSRGELSRALALGIILLLLALVVNLLLFAVRAKLARTTPR
ncbi:MAG: ABC transporter permease [Alphaproteobacteria bacterium]|nr:ABC transporter permease [Alphaproteobacteria bacterium]MDA8004279.1 ABC transporter permease [Alphaproteobacteria bacterium]MDA8006456.1 ABC transporter permease [Alphaproteobacteria bacterium]MDA8013644.1 ABC transporter permease [Alphaproteobacteria bacterium]